MQDIRFKHWPIESLANYAKQQDLVHASMTTFLKVKKWFKISRKRRRKPRKIIGVRATYPNQIWHGDISVIRTNSGLKYYLYMIIDNYSRKIINWRLETTKSGVLWSELLQESCELSPPCTNFWTDEGSEVNNKVLTSTIAHLSIKHTVAQKDVPQSNSMIEAVFRIFKKNYMEYKFPDDRTTLFQKIAWFVHDYNTIKPHRAHQYKLTPNQAFLKQSIDTESLQVLTKHAMQKRKELNKASICKSCA